MRLVCESGCDGARTVRGAGTGRERIGGVLDVREIRVRDAHCSRWIRIGLALGTHAVRIGIAWRLRRVRVGSVWGFAFGLRRGRIGGVCV